MKRNLESRKNKLEEWKDWLNKIYWEISYLRECRTIYLALGEVIQQNIKVFSYTFFIGWFEVNYATTATLTIRRLIDKDYRTYSLLLFLNDILKYHSLISREDFIEDSIKSIIDDPRYKKGDSLMLSLKRKYEKKADKLFTKLAGKNSIINPFAIQKDITQIECTTKNIRKFVNIHIAHHSKEKIEPVLLKEIHICLTVLSRIFQKYHTLIHTCGISFEPSKEEIKSELKHIFCTKIQIS